MSTTEIIAWFAALSPAERKALLENWKAELDRRGM